MEQAIYSVISPEGCASILWKDAKKVAEAADCLRLTAKDMHEFGVVERVISEEGLMLEEIITSMRDKLRETLSGLTAMDSAARLEQRYQRFRKFGA